MGFYQELSRYYDEIFPADREEMAFVAALLRDSAAIVDIGCGTGNKTVLLHPSARITGVDADEGMIARARADNARPGITYTTLDMAGLAGHFAPASCDAAVCLGNTLAHLTTPEALQALCDAVHGLLAPGGTFVCQILNYDRILDRNITDLPVIETAHTRFLRAYERRGGLLLFTTALLLKDGGETLRNVTPLYPLRPDELSAMLARAGFSGEKRYGSYLGAPFTSDSFLLLTTAVA